MTLVQRDWLVLYALGICLISQIPRACAIVHALHRFDECRFTTEGLKEFWRYKKLFSFVGWRSFMGLGDIAKGQGIAMLVTKSFGPEANAAMSIGVRLGGESAIFSSALLNAFAPAITAACGAGDYDKMRLLAYRVCKYSTLLVIMIAIPMALEIKEILRIWLKTPPRYSEGICFCVMLAAILGRCSFGHTIAVMATGKIKFYSLLHGSALMVSVLLAWVFILLGYGLYWVGGAIVIATSLSLVGDLWLARDLVGMKVWHWVKMVMNPLVVVFVCTSLAGMIPMCLLASSPFRILATTLCCFVVFVGVTWFMLEGCERTKLLNLASRLRNKLL